MTYFSFQVLNDIIYNYHKPPRIENSLKTIIFLRGRTKKKKKKHHQQQYQKINYQTQRYLHLLNKGASSGSQSVNKCRGKNSCTCPQKILLKCPEPHTL